VCFLFLLYTDPASPGETKHTVDAAGNAVPAALAATLTAAAATDAAKALDEAINVVRPRLSFSTRARCNP
jgi:hypothetical protein